MKKIIKITEIFTVCIFVLISVSPISFAESDGISDLIGEETESELFDAVPDDVEELLDRLGVNGIDFDSLFSITPEKVWGILKDMLTGQTEAPLKSLVRLLAVIVILAVCECFMPDDDRMKIITEMAGVLMCVVSIISPLSEVITSAVAAIAVSEKFILVLIPVLAAVVSVSGNPALALSFQSMAFYAAQVIAAASKNYIVPVVGTVLALDITCSVMPSFKLSGLTGMIKKTITAVLSFAATLFVSFLEIKGALAKATDTVTTKGIKLIISSAVPVVGGALSEAFSGVVGSLVLVKSALGIFGIVVIALINLPFCFQLLFWIFALRLAAAVGEMLNQEYLANLLKAVSSAMILMNVVLVFNAVIFIISTALVLSLRSI